MRTLPLLASCLFLTAASAQPATRGLVAYPVPDLRAAAEWYAGALGQEPQRTAEAVVFDLGAHGVGLLPLGAEAPWEIAPRCADPAGAVAYWRVPDAAAAVDRLVAAGARVEVPLTTAGRHRTALLTDPFGNRLGVVEGPPITLRPD